MRVSIRMRVDMSGVVVVLVITYAIASTVCCSGLFVVTVFELE